MRLDKFLKTSRIIKRRAVANEACGAGRVTLNGKKAKASADVKPGDVIEVAFGQRTVAARVLSLTENAKKDEAADMYEELPAKEALKEEEELSAKETCE